MARKVRTDAKLKSLGAAQQAAVWDILKASGITDASRQRIREELGVYVGSVRTLSEFYAWYDAPPQRIRRELEAAGSLTSIIVQRMREQQPAASEEELFALGQRVFAEQALATQDVESWVKTQAASRDREKVVLKSQELDLARQKFRRETAEMFLQWSADQRAKEIAGSGASNAEKIESLGRLMFGEDWR